MVALHRVAYLLYAERRRYETGGVLIVGPSGVFMRYIERVLPSLGETAVALRSLGEVVDGVRATRRDEPAVAEVKGSAAMAEVLRRAARQAVPDAPREFRVFYRDDVVHLGGRELGNVRRQLLGMGPRNRSTTKVASTLIDAMWRQVRGERARERTKEEFSEEMRTTDAFLEFADAWWPVLDAATVLGWLRDPEVLGQVSQGVLDDEAVRLLSKSWGDTVSVDDVALLDELRYLLGDPPLVATGSVDDEWLAVEDAAMQEVRTAADREYAGPRGWTPPTNRVEDDGFAHVLVDEAQDLTPMQWRMVGRRGRTATWTVVGDPAQSSWPVPAEAQAAREAAIGDKLRHEFHLSTNYRNSSEIYEFAADYARRVGLDADLPDAVRSTGESPRELRVDDLEAAVREHLLDLAGSLEGTVGVVVPVARLGEVTRWVASWPEVADEFGTPTSRVVVLPGLDTKGLEFDGIVVVAPQEIEDEAPTGRATLYVVYTRATQRMVTLTPA